MTKKTQHTPRKRAFGEHLRKLLNETLVSRPALAKRVGRSRATIGAWLEGRAMPPTETMFAIAEALRLPPERVFQMPYDELPKPPASYLREENLAAYSEDATKQALQALQKRGLILEDSALDRMIREAPAPRYSGEGRERRFVEEIVDVLMLARRRGLDVEAILAQAKAQLEREQGS